MAFINTPLRYPGGKSALSGFLGQVVQANNLEGCTFVEPFAGGAGASIDLLLKGTVNKLCLNDADPVVEAFWWACLHETERFSKAIAETPLTIDEWERQKSIAKNPSESDRFSRGFAAFYLNRTNRSGILTGGVIGGKNQTGKWKMDARFNRYDLIRRIQKIAINSNKISIHGLDALSFLAHVVPQIKEKKFVFIDPPYYKKGSALYLNAYRHDDHEALSSLLRKKRNMKWLVTYDDVPPIRQLYNWCKIDEFSLNYFSYKASKGRELLIRPQRTLLPATGLAIAYNSGRQARRVAPL